MDSSNGPEQIQATSFLKVVLSWWQFVRSVLVGPAVFGTTGWSAVVS